MVKLIPMTRELCHMFYQNFQNDPAIYPDKTQFAPFVYHAAWVDAYFDRQVEKKRIYFAITLNDIPIGELILKNIDWASRSGTLSIHLQNDAVKGKGYGAQAERLAVDYAFHELCLQTIYADTVHQNSRSQHVLQSVGFRFTHEDDTFRYYKIENPEKGSTPNTEPQPEA